MVDLACAEPGFLDLTMVGLDAIPRPGEERLAQDFIRSPGGGAITARWSRNGRLVRLAVLRISTACVLSAIASSTAIASDS